LSTPAFDQICREEWPAVVATLARRLGDLQRAEDAAQEAFAVAASTWPRTGLPPKPGAWVMLTAWRKAIDQLRRDRASAEHHAEAVRLALTGELGRVDEEMFGTEDDQLRLIFTCCHPALAREVRVALTLRYVAGLEIREIARAFLVPVSTMSQRLLRAKKKIRQAGIGFEVPAMDMLAERLAGVQSVIYLVFNEGYAATGGDGIVRADLCDEAIWLGRVLHRLLPRDVETMGLLALMLLHHARSSGRQDDTGRPIALADQDRGTWHAAMISEGKALLEAAMRRRSSGPYQLQAAIAAVHASAPTFEQTDWAQIAALYGELALRVPSPVVGVNRAVAAGMAYGPRAGLTILEPILASGGLTSYAPLHAAHADLLDRAGETDTAAVAWQRVIATTPNEVMREELRRRVAGRPAAARTDGEGTSG
jgi:RNA polymerase sigma-70 factor (ECF subfamily)